MRTATALLSSFALAACHSAPARPPADPETHARELAQRFVILDGHIDVPYRLHVQKEKGEAMDDVGLATVNGDFDLPRARAGGLDAPFFSIYTPAEDEDNGTSKQVAEELIDSCDALIARHPESFELARTAADVRRIARAGKIAVLYGMENGSPVEGKLENVDHFFQRGVRYITLAHGKDNHLSDSSYDTRHTHGGLSPFGVEVVRRMNELGILVDVSHLSDEAFADVLANTKAPVIASHSSLRHFVPGFERNLSDDMVRTLAKNGGVVQINFGSSFLTAAANSIGFTRHQAIQAFAQEKGLEESAPEVLAFAEAYDAEHPFPIADVKDVADHIDRVVELAGVEHVGFGSDFDGVGPTLPTGLKDVSMYPNLLAELLRRGYSEGDLEKICGENVLRVMERAEAVARESRRH